MQYEIIGAMTAKAMLSMLKHEHVEDLAHVESGSVTVAQYSYAKSGIAASLLKRNERGETVVNYKVLGALPLGIKVDEVRDILKRNDKVLVFHSAKTVASAIAYSGDLDLDLVESLCDQINNSMRPRDTQRSKVYAFCDDHTRELGKIKGDDARLLAKRVAEDYGIPLSKVIFDDSLESQRYDGLCYTLPFDMLVVEPAFNVVNCRTNGTGMWLATVIHELAHMVVRYEYGDDSALGHGPAFVSLYIEMLAKYGINRNDCPTMFHLVEHYVNRAKHFKVKLDAHCIRVGDEWFADRPVVRAKKKRTRASL